MEIWLRTWGITLLDCQPFRHVLLPLNLGLQIPVVGKGGEQGHMIKQLDSCQGSQCEGGRRTTSTPSLPSYSLRQGWGRTGRPRAPQLFTAS